MNPQQWAYYHIFNKPPGARTVLPIGQSILFGLVFFMLLCGIPIAFGFISYGAGMGALVVLGMAGLAFGYRSGMMAALGATFVALLPAAMAVQGAVDYRAASKGTFVEIGAYDGESFSNTSFLADLGWNGLYVEPVPKFAALCRARHRALI